MLRTYVVDSVVLTDLEIADALLEAPLALRFDLAVPDLIEAYGEAEKHDAREVEGVVVFLDRHPELTMHEAWALFLCASRGYGLLTRSPQLVRAASDAHVTTHGTLWLLDHLVVAGCLSPPEAVAAVRRLQSSGRGFTQVERDKFMDRWDPSEPG